MYIVVVADIVGAKILLRINEKNFFLYYKSERGGERPAFLALDCVEEGMKNIHSFLEGVGQSNFYFYHSIEFSTMQLSKILLIWQKKTLLLTIVCLFSPLSFRAMETNLCVHFLLLFQYRGGGL